MRVYRVIGLLLLSISACRSTQPSLAAGAPAENVFFWSGTEGDRRADPTKLVIMSFNAEFLWDGVQPEEGQADFDWKGSQTEAEEHMRRVAAVIVQHNPDIVNLVEVENEQALTVFNNQFLQGQGYKPYLIKGTDTGTGQDVALLTRVDPDSIQRDNERATVGGTNSGVSKNYYSTFSITAPGAPSPLKLAMIGIHLVAFPLRSDRVGQRNAQATVVRNRAVSLRNAGYEVVVLGDFNDYDGLDLDHINSTPNSLVLRTIRSMEQTTTADDLVNAAQFVAKANRYTAHWDQDRDGNVDHPNEHTSIDHVLLSPNLATKVTWADIPHNHNPLQVSDHYPVVVTLTLSTQAVGKVFIRRLLPAPAGNDEQNEEATIRNTTNANVDLTGWKLRDTAGKVWALDSLGTVAPNQDKTIKRLGQPMAMNNSGDTIELLNQSGTPVHKIAYGQVGEGEEVTSDN